MWKIIHKSWRHFLTCTLIKDSTVQLQQPLCFEKYQVKEVAHRAKTDTLIAWKARNIALILEPKDPWNPLERSTQRGWIYIVTQLIHRAETKRAQCLVFPSKSTLYDKNYNKVDCKIKAQKHSRRRWRESFCISNRLIFLL